MNLIGREYTTGGGKVFIVIGEKGRFLEVELYDGTAMDVPRDVFNHFVAEGHYREIMSGEAGSAGREAT